MSQNTPNPHLMPKILHTLQGMYDILVRLNATKEIMKETVRTKLRYVGGVRSVLTLFEYENLR